MAGLTCHPSGTLLNCAMRACHPNTLKCLKAKLNTHKKKDTVRAQERMIVFQVSICQVPF